MIVGLGTDITELARIRASYDRFGERFQQKILTSLEQAAMATDYRQLYQHMLLKDAGIRARSLLGWQIPITTDDDFGRARIRSIDSNRLRKHLEDYDVLVVAGFQGCTEDGRITTLGRGGSDTSAVALAAVLGSVECDIYTDVDGVYTTDPNICSTARKMDRVAYEEMLEMASMGVRRLSAQWGSPRPDGVGIFRDLPHQASTSLTLAGVTRVNTSSFTVRAGPWSHMHLCRYVEDHPGNRV